ncbi:MAG: hypothetical protein H5U11_13700 [Rhizobium sp.]|nr:hypothetical protein [Rhizobium sp.]
MNSVFTREVTPEISNPVVQQLAERIGSEHSPLYVKRVQQPLPLGGCYWNVAHKVDQHGGEMVTGWAIAWWPKFYGVAMHHAVWRMPDGTLADVTEPMPFDHECNAIIFIADERTEVRLDISPTIDNIFAPLAEDTAVHDFIEAYHRKEAIRRQLSELNWQIGYRCERMFAKASGLPLPPPMEVPQGPIAEKMRYLMFRYQSADRDVGSAIIRLSGDGPNG